MKPREAVVQQVPVPGQYVDIAMLERGIERVEPAIETIGRCPQESLQHPPPVMMTHSLPYSEHLNFVVRCSQCCVSCSVPLRRGRECVHQKVLILDLHVRDAAEPQQGSDRHHAALVRGRDRPGWKTVHSLLRSGARHPHGLVHEEHRLVEQQKCRIYRYVEPARPCCLNGTRLSPQQFILSECFGGPAS